MTDKDRDNIRAFKLRMMSGMERQTFNQMQHLFRHKLEISSDWIILRRMGILSEIEPIWYDCCINSSTLPSPGYSMWNPWNGGWTAEIPGGFHGMVDGFHGMVDGFHTFGGWIPWNG